MRAHASVRLSNVRGTTPELLGSHRGSVCPLSVAPRVTFGALVWLGKRDSPTRHPLLPLNAGTAEPFRVSPPEAVAYQLELSKTLRSRPFIPDGSVISKERIAASPCARLSRTPWTGVTPSSTMGPLPLLWHWRPIRLPFSGSLGGSGVARTAISP
jgi:hypothetical protein